MRNNRGHLTAVLRSARQPSKEQVQRFQDFLARNYQRKIPLNW